MNRRLLEVETIALTIFAALPLYAADATSSFAIAIFHAALSLVAVQILFRGNPPEVLGRILRVLGIAYILFFPFDAIAISRSLVGASTHLLFFIAVYQAVDPENRVKDAQRLLVTFLIFVTSVATSTSLPIVFFVLAFTFLAFRELIRLSHDATLKDIGRAADGPPSRRAAAFYVIPTAVIAAMLFPVIPRARSPFVRGLTGALPGTATGLSDSIDFSVARTISPDPEVVARVWMARDAMPFFTPLRLRGNVYDAYEGERWVAGGERISHPVANNEGTFEIAGPLGFTREATIQQRATEEGKLYLPRGTYSVAGVPNVIEWPTYGIFRSYALIRRNTTYTVMMSRDVLPARPEPIPRLAYAASPQIESMARSIIGDSTDPKAIAAKIEAYMSRNFRYLADPAALGRAITVEEFLLQVRRGHCEYFAAGMVVLLNSVGIPARIVGGFYGGDLNPLTGYLIVRKRDAHAWVEVFDGEKWMTFDPTPTTLRPGNQQKGLLAAYSSAIGDSVTYVWDRYILTFGLADQMALFEGLFERTRGTIRELRQGWRPALASLVRPLAIGFIVMIPVAAAGFLLARRRRASTFDQLARALAASGIEVASAMTPGEIMREVEGKRPELADAVRRVLDFYVAERFSGRTPPERMRTAARRALEALRASRRSRTLISAADSA